ncbi:MAG: DUF4113 domain-containing protein [Desulfomonilia bacterium]
MAAFIPHPYPFMKAENFPGQHCIRETAPHLLPSRRYPLHHRHFERPWRMRQAEKSPRFTTSWADLPRVKA